MGYDVSKLAHDTFVKPDNKEPDDHQERHAYYKTLVAREKAGEQLDDEDKTWLAKAREAVERGAKSVDVHRMAEQHFIKGLDTGPVITEPAKTIKGFDVGPANVELTTGTATVTPAKSNKLNYAKTEEYDPRQLTPLQSYALGIGSLPDSMMSFKQAALNTPTVNIPQGPAMEKNAQLNERGQVVYPDEQAKPNYQFKLPAGGVGQDEAGYVVDRKGKRLGSLDQDENVRTLDRRPSDVSLADKDQFGSDQLERMYGPHLKEVEDNGGKYPAGYFDGMSKSRKANIKAGVVELMRRRKGNRT